MSFLLRKIFRMPEIQPGQRWECRRSDPFDDRWIITVLDVKDGYVKWQSELAPECNTWPKKLPPSSPQHERIAMFRMIAGKLLED